jgi:hypothetical protein
MRHITKNKTKLLAVVLLGILGLAYWLFWAGLSERFFWSGVNLVFEKVFMGKMEYNVYDSLGITLSGWKNKKNILTDISAGGKDKDINQCKLGFVWKEKKYKICELTIDDMQEVGLFYLADTTSYLTYSSRGDNGVQIIAVFLEDKIYRFSFSCASYSNSPYHFYIDSENEMPTYFIMPVTRTDMIRKLGEPGFNYSIPML